VTRKSRILIPVGPSGKGLKSVHYAMALAERLEAEIFIVHLSNGSDAGESAARRFGEDFGDIINSARLAGLKISEHLAENDDAEELVEVIREEGIDVVVFSADDTQCAQILNRIKSRISLQIIQVSEKEHAVRV